MALTTSLPSPSPSPSLRPNPMQPTITHATRQDVPVILEMIKELADYEKVLNLVQATEQSLLNTLVFPDTPGSPPSGPGYAKVFLVRTPQSEGTAGNKVAGMAVYFNNFSTWRSAPGVYLDDLYVRPEYRKRGYGKLLIKALAVECKMIGGGRVEWCCLKWNEPSLQFYRSLGAVEMKEWVTLRLDGEALENMVNEVTK